MHTTFMQIEKQIQSYITENLLFAEGPFPYENDTSFLQEGILDSVGVMELVAFAESTFSIRVAPQEVTPANFDSVNNLSAFIRGKLAAPQT